MPGITGPKAQPKSKTDTARGCAHLYDLARTMPNSVEREDGPRVYQYTGQALNALSGLLWAN